MIKALFLIFKPMAAWDGILKARRGPGFLLTFYLLPMMLIVAAGEGCGLVKWGKPQWGLMHRVQKFTAGEALIYEAAQSLLTLLVIAVCVWLIRIFGDTFHKRNTCQQTFTLVIYGLGPMFLLRLLDATPTPGPWVTWPIGIILSIGVVYHGLPRVMEPDPPNAFGLFFMSSLLLAAMTGLERFVTAWYLAGRIPPATNFISHLAAHLPF